jgi:peroxiredoxin
MGFQLIAVALDPPAKLGETKEKYGIQGGFLSDSKMTAAQAFGVAYKVDSSTLKQLKEYGVDLEEASGEKHHQLPVPAVFISGIDGAIQFTYANPDFTVRIRPEMLLSVARTVQKE